MGENIALHVDATTHASRIKQNRVVAIDQLKPHTRNYRSHPKSQIDKLVLSLQRFGQGRSIVVQDAPERMIIVAGHGIVEAAQALKWQELRADILPADWTSEQVTGYLIADNMHSQEATDDETLLAELLQEQQNLGYDLASLGTDDETLRQMLESLGDEHIGRTTELNEPAGGEVESAYNVLIECENELEQQRAYEIVDREGFKCRVLTL